MGKLATSPGVLLPIRHCEELWHAVELVGVNFGLDEEGIDTVDGHYGFAIAY